MSSERGQALMLAVGIMWATVLAALVLGGVASAIRAGHGRQRAADLAALAAVRSMQESFDRLYEQPTVAGRANPRRIGRAEYEHLARTAAADTARRNGTALRAARLTAGQVPLGIRVEVESDVVIAGVTIEGRARASAEVVSGFASRPGRTGAGMYSGPLAHRQGKPMRPDVALAFDRMAAAARTDGIALLIVSAFRSDEEQARLFARNPDPKRVAPPGRSLHRLGTELDLGPAGAYGWLSRNARRFGFVQRYSWEPWHYGFTLNAGSASLGFGDGVLGVVPGFVPERYAAAFARSAQRWNVSSTLLAAQVWQESRFDPDARSRAGAVGLAQFMPATARAYGLVDPTDPIASIDAQAHLMRDLLREFGSVPLALAAYNAGPARVRACGCVPPIPETVGYVAAILARMGGVGDSAGVTGGLAIRLVS